MKEVDSICKSVFFFFQIGLLIICSFTYSEIYSCALVRIILALTLHCYKNCNIVFFQHTCKENSDLFLGSLATILNSMWLQPKLPPCSLVWIMLNCMKE
jgi:hypothetical protein